MRVEIKRFQQPNDYSCGPAVLKMLADYFNLKNKKKQEYSFSAINRMSKCSKTYGTPFSNFNSALTKLGLKKKRISLHELYENGTKNPVVALVEDGEDDHYVIISGIEYNMAYIVDPYYPPQSYVGSDRMEDKIVKNSKGEPWLYEISHKNKKWTLPGDEAQPEPVIIPKSALDEIDELKRKLSAAKRTLKYYADQGNYRFVMTDEDMGDMIWTADSGDKARMTLKGLIGD